MWGRRSLICWYWCLIWQFLKKSARVPTKFAQLPFSRIRTHSKFFSTQTFVLQYRYSFWGGLNSATENLAQSLGGGIFNMFFMSFFILVNNILDGPQIVYSIGNVFITSINDFIYFTGHSNFFFKLKKRRKMSLLPKLNNSTSFYWINYIISFLRIFWTFSKSIWSIA